MAEAVRGMGTSRQGGFSREDAKKARSGGTWWRLGSVQRPDLRFGKPKEQMSVYDRENAAPAYSSQFELRLPLLSARSSGSQVEKPVAMVLWCSSPICFS